MKDNSLSFVALHSYFTTRNPARFSSCAALSFILTSDWLILSHPLCRDWLVGFTARQNGRTSQLRVRRRGLYGMRVGGESTPALSCSRRFGAFGVRSHHHKANDPEAKVRRVTLGAVSVT